MAKGSIKQNKVIEELKSKREPIDENCKKVIEDELHICSRSDGEVCGVYAFPKAKWRNGDCPMCDSQLKTVIEEEIKTDKVRVGQQKQKKHR